MSAKRPPRKRPKRKKPKGGKPPKHKTPKGDEDVPEYGPAKGEETADGGKGGKGGKGSSGQGSASTGDPDTYTATDGTEYTTPPYLTYDPGLDAQRRALQRGVEQAEQDFETQRRIDRQDYKQTKKDIKRDAKRGRQDIRTDLRRGRVGYQQKREDIERSRRRGEQDFQQRLGTMFLRYGIKARVQSQSANAQGVADAGTLGASNAARAANLARDKGVLDLAHSRQQQDLGTALARTNLAQSQFVSDIQRSKTRLGQDTKRSKKLAGRDFRRARRAARRELVRAQLEAAIGQTDITQQMIYQAQQTNPGAVDKYGNPKKKGT